jgi:glyoxylase-like metal-dependent hydrolase (beta-lactamase superfamily II)
MVAHVLLVERDAGLLLVDTGYGSGELADPGRLGKPYQALVRPVLDPAETALTQVKELGFAPEDVTDIALTHLDSDHAGGLVDFPHARVHLHRLEYDAATNPTTREKARYRPAQWAHGPQWVRHDEPGDDWFGFPAVTALDGDIVIVPLLGHTRGHAGVAVRDGSDHWLLHAGDAIFDQNQVQTPASCHRGVAIIQTLMAVDNKVRRSNTERLQELVASHSDEVTVICAHDKAQYDALAARV